MNNTRGTIRNREASNAVKNYMKLRWKNITPTDIDGLIDFKNKLFVIIELKRSGEELKAANVLPLKDWRIRSHRRKNYAMRSWHNMILMATSKRTPALFLRCAIIGDGEHPKKA